MKDGIAALTRLQETSSADKVPVSAAILELAGSQQLVPPQLRSTGSGRYGSYTPAPLQGALSLSWLLLLRLLSVGLCHSCREV